MAANNPGRFSRAWELGKRLWREKPVPIAIALVLMSALAGPAIEVIADRLEIMGIKKYQFILIGFLLVGLLFALSLLIRARPSTTIAPPLPLERLSVRSVFSQEELRKLRTGLHMDLYGGVAPDSTEIDQMYVRNPRMAVALYDEELQDFVGFAAAWPIRKPAALKLIGGQINENQLKATDVLTAAQNDRAEYLLVPAFGTAQHRRAALGRDLYYELRASIRRNYLTRPGRSVTLIATGYSPDGERWCERMGMTRRCQVQMDGEQYPVFTRTITSEDAD
jgi:hypothetical protein